MIFKKKEMIAFIQDSFPELEINHWKVIEGGWDNQIIIINHNLAFRFPNSNITAQSVKMEVKLLRTLRKCNLQLQVPNYEMLFADNGELNCVFYSYIKGDTLHHQSIDSIPNQDENAKLLGNFLTTFHHLNLYLELPKVHSTNYWEKLYNETNKIIYPHINMNEQKAITEIFEAFLHDYTEDIYSKTIIHGDLGPSNIIINNEKGLVNGVIDFTDAQFSDPAFDFAGFYWHFGPDFTKKVLAHYDGVDSGVDIFRRVQSFYGLQPIFHELLYNIKTGVKINWKSAFDRFFELKG